MFERGALLLIPFPYSDLSASKRRPVLALTEPDRYGDFIALAVTSRSHHAMAIELKGSDLVEGELPVVSWIRSDRVVTLNASLVVKPFARVSESVLQMAVKSLCSQLGGT